MKISLFFMDLKNLADIEVKIDLIVENYEPKTKVQLEIKKRVISILNKIIIMIPIFLLKCKTILNAIKYKYIKQVFKKGRWFYR